MAHSIVLIIGGVILLVAGAELMVRGAARVALTLGLSSLFVGLTVVAFATSAPELVVAIQASFQGVSDLAIGNVVGSNICNIGIILGLTAIITPIPCHVSVIRREVPIMIGATVLFGAFCLGGTLGRIQAALLAATLVAYIVWTYRSASRAPDNHTFEELPGIKADPKGPAPSIRVMTNLLLIGFGLGGLVFGAELLVEGAVDIASSLGMSEVVIGLTVVAVGTSLPEVATSLVAALKKEPDIAIGNVIGSNLWNLLGGVVIAGII